MDITIQNSDPRPIYSQIEDQFKAMILNGNLKEGDALPSMRRLAKELRISLITTKRAYEDLEREGYIYTVAGKGCFVAEKTADLLREGHLRQMEEYLEKAVNMATMCNITYDEFLQLVDLYYKGE